ncbi:hypothetical protein MA16_Dca022791 [Dendrobium catenatum]|uniref:Uncharacterized protein n=1 Tax=Dendrobium catenatum TaxID=906689 RepID=A0A2I0X3Z4_9ASPA|nr:hypothetical protein MA16_Dca022791 [Dendrobium catenatum]
MLGSAATSICAWATWTRSYKWPSVWKVPLMLQRGNLGLENGASRGGVNGRWEVEASVRASPTENVIFHSKMQGNQKMPYFISNPTPFCR